MSSWAHNFFFGTSHCYESSGGASTEQQEQEKEVCCEERKLNFLKSAESVLFLVS
jgi:hypothetical protein